MRVSTFLRSENRRVGAFSNPIVSLFLLTIFSTHEIVPFDFCPVNISRLCPAYVWRRREAVEMLSRRVAIAKPIGQTDFLDSTRNTLCSAILRTDRALLTMSSVCIYIGGTPRAYIKSYRSTPVTIGHCSCRLSRGWHFVQGSGTLLVACNPVFTYFQTPAPVTDSGCSATFLTSFFETHATR